MLYLLLIASLCILKATAQSCDNLDTSDCEATSGCQVVQTFLCQTEGGPNCCEDATTTTTTTTTTSYVTTPSPTYECPTPSSFTSCEDIYTEECCTDYDECVVNDAAICDTTDAPGGECCETATTTSTTTTSTTTTTTTTTEAPTLSPTCPTNLEDCEDYEEAGCCPSDCVTVRKGVCLTEGGPGCCESPTTTTTSTTTTTTEEPTTTTTTTSTTTEATTTEEPTTTEEETTTTEKTTTEEPTTTEKETTTTEKETTTTEKETTTTEKETTTTEEETTTTSGKSWPTPKPTMRSAEKWEMIHPAYEGSDGELLWHVYYGDFSSDDRFDSFRKGEKWDTKEIKPIIMHDKQFKKYRNANSKKFRDQSAVVTDNNAGAQSYGSWLIGVSAVLILLFAVWYRFGGKNDKSEYQPLLSEEKVQYDQ